jgi:predicted O-methyltransferase YrrM
MAADMRYRVRLNPGMHMPNTLHSEKVAALLACLFAASDEKDPALLARIKHEADAKHGGNRYAPELMPLFDDVYMPVPPEVGQLVYLLVRTKRPKLAVEIGTSFGISAIHFAAALADNGAGRLISAEMSEAKANAARANLESVGLSHLVEIRRGDAFETLKALEPSSVDILFLDGWKDFYLPFLKMLEPKLAPGALVVGDDTKLFPERLADYLAYVRDPKNGYHSVDLPMGDVVELSLRT